MRPSGGRRGLTSKLYALELESQWATKAGDVVILSAGVAGSAAQSKEEDDQPHPCSIDDGGLADATADIEVYS